MAHNLTELPCQEEATIVGFNCSEIAKKQFLEEGFLPGTRVSIDSSSPFGGPIMCTLRNCKIALRRRDAKAIIIHTR